MNIQKAVSAIQNDVVAGLPGLSNMSKFSLEQIEDDIIEERLAVIKDYSIKNLLPVKDLIMSIDCIPVDCGDITGCCGDSGISPQAHFKVPQILNDWGMEGIQYIGSVDRMNSFKVYTDMSFRNHKYRRRGATKPYVWINTTPDAEGMYNGYVFNTPFLKLISISAVFKDPRQLDIYSCCNFDQYDNKSFIDTEVRRRLTEKYIRYYRQMATAHTPNTQQT